VEETLGLPLMVAIIDGETRRFRPLVDVYREYGRRAGHAPDQLKVGVHALGYVAETTQRAIEDFYPGYAKTITRQCRQHNRVSWKSWSDQSSSPLLGKSQSVARPVRRGLANSLSSKAKATHLLQSFPSIRFRALGGLDKVVRCL
jgi:alkanesulfonate monooxygenase SsuD/methylene tetrahydromethanopterin reductase-like flavin-dependent oxidoreductase (luciferase family)